MSMNSSMDSDNVPGVSGNSLSSDQFDNSTEAPDDEDGTVHWGSPPSGQSLLDSMSKGSNYMEKQRRGQFS